MAEPITITILGVTIAVTLIIAAIGTTAVVIQCSIMTGDKIYHRIRRKAEKRFKKYHHFDTESGIIYSNALQCLQNTNWMEKSKYVMPFDEYDDIIACILVLRLQSSSKTKPKKIRMLYYEENNRIRMMSKTGSQLQKFKTILDKYDFIPETDLRFIKTEANVDKIK